VDNFVDNIRITHNFTGIMGDSLGKSGDKIFNFYQRNPIAKVSKEKTMFYNEMGDKGTYKEEAKASERANTINRPISTNHDAGVFTKWL